MRILFRVDSSLEIGTGHVVRCLSLAHALRNNGHQVSFWSLDLPGNDLSSIRKNGYSLFDPASSDRFDLAIVDHYGIDQEGENHIRQWATSLVAIDDWGTRLHHADLILDPSVSTQSTLRIKANPTTPFLTGFDWLLMRDDFKKLHPEVPPRTEFKKVLLFFGGTDPQSQCLSYLEALLQSQNEFNHLEFHMMVSAVHPTLKQMQSLKLPNHVHLEVSPPSVAKLMRNSDLYLGSSGTVTWERMAMGLTGLIVSVVDNQEDIAKNLDQMGFHRYLGKCQDVTPKFALEKLKELLNQSEMISRMSSLCYQKVDGQGVDRFVQELENRFKAT